MAGSRCRVSYTDSEGITHAVEVDAVSLYEAVALAAAEFRQDEIITDGPAPMTEFCVTVLRKSTAPSSRLAFINRRWRRDRRIRE